MVNSADEKIVLTTFVRLQSTENTGRQSNNGTPDRNTANDDIGGWFNVHNPSHSDDIAKCVHYKGEQAEGGTHDEVGLV